MQDVLMLFRSIGKRARNVCMTHARFEKLHYNSVNSAFFSAIASGLFSLCPFVLHSWNLIFPSLSRSPWRLFISQQEELLNNKRKKNIRSALFHQFLTCFYHSKLRQWETLQFSEYFYPKLFVKYHEFNIMGQVRVIYCACSSSRHMCNFSSFLPQECVGVMIPLQLSSGSSILPISRPNRRVIV